MPAALPVWHVKRKQPDYRVCDNEHRRHKGLHTTPLSEVQAVVGDEFFATHTIDKVSLPLKPDPLGELGDVCLDMERIAWATGEQVSLGVVTCFRHSLCQFHDLAMKLAGDSDEVLCRGKFDRVDMRNLEGRLMPVYTSAGTRKDDEGAATYYSKFAPLTADKKHPFACLPAVLLSMVDKGAKADTRAMALGYIVSPRAFNVLEDDGELGLSFGDDVQAGLQGSLYYFLVVSAVDPGTGGLHVTMSASNPLDDSFWRWALWDKAPSIGLGDMCMHSGGVLRKMLLDSIAQVARNLAEWRQTNKIENMLFSRLKVDGNSRGGVEGLVVRKAMLMERLLTGTPMQFLLDGTPAGDDLLGLRVPVPRASDGGPPAKALYDELRRWTTDPEFSAWFGNTTNV